MSRSGYSDDIDTWQLIRWRGAVASALRGKRGQSFLREMLVALDALREKRLVRNALEADGDVCALGSVGRQRSLNMADVDPGDHESVAALFGIPHAMACEIMDFNDDGTWDATPEKRFKLVRDWIVARLAASPTPTEQRPT